MEMPDAGKERLRTMLSATPECLPVEQLSFAVDGRAGESERRAAEQHIAGCPYCQTQLALAQDFESAKPARDEEAQVAAIVNRLRRNAPAASATSWWRRLTGVRGLAPVLAATVVVLVVTGLLFRARHHEDGLSFEPGRDDVVRSQSVEGMTPVGDLADPPAELRWGAVAGANRYTVRLLEADRTAIWEASVTQPSVLIPAGVRQRLANPGVVLWQVQALNAAGAVIGESGFQQIHIGSRASR